MLRDAEVRSFLTDHEFQEMLNKVGHDDWSGYKNNNAWLSEHPAKAIIFEQVVQTWQKLSPVYNGDFKDLVTGNLPEESALIQTLLEVAERLKQVEWTVGNQSSFE